MVWGFIFVLFVIVVGGFLLIAVLIKVIKESADDCDEVVPSILHEQIVIFN